MEKLIRFCLLTEQRSVSFQTMLKDAVSMSQKALEEQIL